MSSVRPSNQTLLPCKHMSAAPQLFMAVLADHSWHLCHSIV